MSGRHMAFPFHIGSDGRCATYESLADHVRGEVIQLLLTNPGERPMMPVFGAGLRRLVFEGNQDITAGIAKAAISQSISFWLQERVELILLEVTPIESTLNVDISYKVIATGEKIQLRFQHEQ